MNDASSQVRARRDRCAGDGLLPSASLRAGPLITDDLALPLDMAPGGQNLLAGLYQDDVEGCPRPVGPVADHGELASVEAQ